MIYIDSLQPYTTISRYPLIYINIHGYTPTIHLQYLGILSYTKIYMDTLQPYTTLSRYPLIYVHNIHGYTPTLQYKIQVFSHIQKYTWIHSNPTLQYPGILSYKYINIHKVRFCVMNMTVRVIFSNPPCKDYNVLFKMNYP